MKLPHLQINNQLMQIGIKQQSASIELHQPMADIKYNQPQPEVKMTKTESKLEIDQTEAFADANLKSPLRVTNEWAAEAKRRVLQDMANEIVQGNRMMSIEGRKENIIPQLAKEDSQPGPKTFNISYMPESIEKVRFNYTPSEINVDVNLEGFKLDVKVNNPTIKFHEGNLSIYTRQKSAISIKAVGLDISV